MPTNEELRKHRRYDAHIPVAVYCYYDDERREIVEGHCSNISEGGARINCTLPVNIDRKILVKFLIDENLFLRAVLPKTELTSQAEASLPQGISSKAVICWGDVLTGFGVQFVEIDEARKKIIKNLIDQVIAGKYPPK